MKLSDLSLLAAAHLAGERLQYYDNIEDKWVDCPESKAFGRLAMRVRPKPREWWISKSGIAYANKPHVDIEEFTHVREVTDE